MSIEEGVKCFYRKQNNLLNSFHPAWSGLNTLRVMPSNVSRHENDHEANKNVANEVLFNVNR